MAPRKKKVEAQQVDVEEAIQAAKARDDGIARDANQKVLEEMTGATPASLIKEFLTLKAHGESESKRFQEYLKPTVDRMAAIKSSLHARALEDKVNGFPTDEGTAYLSEITSHKIDPEATYQTADGRISKGRDALLDWMLDNWDEYGSEGIQLNISKAIVERWMESTATEENKDGVPPPGLKIDKFKQLNIKRS